MLKNSPNRDTVFYYYPLDSAQLQLLGSGKASLDSDIFLRHQPIRFYEFEDEAKQKQLPHGTYLRSSIYGFSISRSLLTQEPQRQISYIQDGAHSFVIVKDPKSNRILKNLRLYFGVQAQQSSFAAGRGGYPLSLANNSGVNQYFLMNDNGAWTLRVFSANKVLQQEDKDRSTSQYGGYASYNHPNASYLILSQPKYKPGDTIKAYTYQIVGKRGRPLRSKMEVMISDGHQKIFWKGKVKPQKAGSYRLNFPIPDSFQLDKTYSVSFRYFFNESWHAHEQSFVYQDYELNKATYDFFLQKAAYKAGDSINCFLMAKDENGFAAPFGKFSIDVYVRSIAGISRDTLGYNLNQSVYHLESELSGEGLESRTIPAELLPEGNSNVQVVCTLTNELNQELTWSKNFNYDNNPHEMVFGQSGDTLKADYLYLRKSGDRELSYLIQNFFGDTIEQKTFRTPLRLLVRAPYDRISFLDGKKNIYSLKVRHNAEGSIGLQTYQNGDSVYIRFQSRGEEIVYYTILKNGREILADSGLSLRFSAAANPKDRYELLYAVEQQHNKDASLSYRHWHIIPNDKKLKISDNLPNDVLPGSDVQVTLSIRDYAGRPLKNVDISSYGFKSQFGEADGTHQFFIYPPLADTLYEHLTSADWRLGAAVPASIAITRRINSRDIERYQLFHYPYYRFYFQTDRIYQEDIPLRLAQKYKDSTALLSVNFVQGGTLFSPVWITADDKPIFYAATSRECIAMVPPGKHKLRLQLSNVLYELDEMMFLAGHKKLISINQDSGDAVVQGLHILRKNMPTLELDSAIRDAILQHSFLINELRTYSALREAPALLRFSHMRRYLTGAGIGLIDFEDTRFKMFGPYYENEAVLTVDSAIHMLPIGDKLLHYYADSAKQIAPETRPIPEQPWPASVQQYDISQLFDILYHPPLPEPEYQQSRIEQNGYNDPNSEKKAPKVVPIFETRTPSIDGRQTIVVIFDGKNRIKSAAVVPRWDIEHSSFLKGENQSSYQLAAAGTGKSDLFFQLSDGTTQLYRDVNLETVTHFYVNTDSLKGDTASESDIRFYNNVYLSLNGTMDQYFTDYPEFVSVQFGRTATGRNNTLLRGRLRELSSENENVYLESNGRFVAGAQADAEGYFEFLNVTPGIYMLKVHPTNARPVYVYNLKIEANSAYMVDIAPTRDPAPLVLSAGNKHYRLDVWQHPGKGSVLLLNSKTKEIITSGANISYQVEGKTVYTSSFTGGRAAFPDLEWPETVPYDMTITIPGYNAIKFKDLKTAPVFSYQWQFLLSPTLKTDRKEEFIYIKGSDINNSLPTLVTELQQMDTLAPVLPGKNYEIHARIGASDPLAKKGTPVAFRLYKENRLIKKGDLYASYDMIIGDVAEAGTYQLRLQVKDASPQLITFTLSKRGRHYLTVNSFIEEQIEAPLVKQKSNANYEKGKYRELNSVTVRAQRSRASQNKSISAERIEAAPSRNLVDLPGLSSDVSQSRTSAALSIGGARADGTVYMIDGQINVVLSPSGNALKEVVVRTNLSTDQSNAMKANPTAQKLRENFSDASHFTTGLRTDKTGSTTFHIQFPDDITQWDVFQTALGKHYVFGNSKKKISAFKPVMAIVRTPRFLYKGDSAEIGLNIRNLTEGSKEAEWQSNTGDIPIIKNQGTLKKGISDSGYVFAVKTGPMSFYSKVTTRDSFIDQELRSINVQRPAISSYSDTSFSVVDTSFVIQKDTNEEVVLNMHQTLNEYFYQTIKSLEEYPYSCVEQQCSKIKALLYAEKLARHTGQVFRKKQQIRKLVKQLESNSNINGSFGWWKGQSDITMSLIAYDALMEVRNAGYLERGTYALGSFLRYQASQQDSVNSVRILATMLASNTNIGEFKKHPNIARLNANQFPNAFDRLNFLVVKGTLTDTFDTQKIFLALQLLQQHTGKGIYADQFINAPSVQLMQAFRLLRHTPLADSIRPYMQRFIDAGLHTRTRNTYEQSLALQSLFDFSLSRKEKSKSYYQINESKSQQLFPLKMNLSEAATRVRYKGLKGWVRIDRIRQTENPLAKDTFFKVNTRIVRDGINQAPDALRINEEYGMVVNVYHYKTYDHVMITIPIPAGLSLKRRIPLIAGISHIDYYPDRIVLYCSRMNSGNHSWTIPLRAMFRGNYVWAPVRAELMYESQIYGHNTFQSIKIR